jgi:hypothetical protein
MNISESVPAHCCGFDYSRDWPALIKPIVSAKDRYSPVPENLVSYLLEREGTIVPPFTEGRRTFDILLKERLPATIEPLHNILNTLTSDRLPMAFSGVTEFRQMGFQFGFR